MTGDQGNNVTGDGDDRRSGILHFNNPPDLGIVAGRIRNREDDIVRTKLVWINLIGDDEVTDDVAIAVIDNGGTRVNIGFSSLCLGLGITIEGDYRRIGIRLISHNDCPRKTGRITGGIRGGISHGKGAKDGCINRGQVRGGCSAEDIGILGAAVLRMTVIPGAGAGRIATGVPTETKLFLAKPVRWRTGTSSTIAKAKLEIQPTAKTSINLAGCWSIPSTVIQNNLPIDLEPYLIINILIKGHPSVIILDLAGVDDGCIVRPGGSTIINVLF